MEDHLREGESEREEINRWPQSVRMSASVRAWYGSIMNCHSMGRGREGALLSRPARPC